MSEWKDKMVAAYHEQMAITEVVAEEAFIKCFGCSPTKVKGCSVWKDDVELRLVGSFNADPVWAVVGPCPECGERCCSSECHTFADIGKNILHFEPSPEHFR